MADEFAGKSHLVIDATGPAIKVSGKTHLTQESLRVARPQPEHQLTGGESDERHLEPRTAD